MADSSTPTSQTSSPSPKDGVKLNSTRTRWALGILQDNLTDEVPGSVLLLSKVHKNNAPLGMDHMPPSSRPASSSGPTPPHSQPTSPYPRSEAMFRTTSQNNIRSQSHARSQSKIRSWSRTRLGRSAEKKRTKDGKIILEPQPEDSANDPLNWSPLRRDAALVSLGIYCMLGGGMTPVLAAGFNEVAGDFGVSVPQVALTTGLYMLGLGVGSVIFSPTAIILGKRPIYLATSVLFALTAVWCALSPNYASLIVARVVQGIAVSPVECLPSATIAEIFFLHERAYRLGIYTLLLLGGKNLVPLASAAIIQRLGWRWVFWIVAMVVGFCGMLLFFFVPETFWDRSPTPHNSSGKQNSSADFQRALALQTANRHDAADDEAAPGRNRSISGALSRRREMRRARFASESRTDTEIDIEKQADTETQADLEKQLNLERQEQAVVQSESDGHLTDDKQDSTPPMSASDKEPLPDAQKQSAQQAPVTLQAVPSLTTPPLLPTPSSETPSRRRMAFRAYTDYYRSAPVKSYLQTLKPWDGYLGHDNWFKVAARPFVLFAYPAILWSSAVYMLSVGWLIVLSESVDVIYMNRDSYNFTALQTGLVYISPFVGGVLGTAVAGKVSDIIVKAMSRRNGGIYEPEFRLVMAIPVAITTAIGLMGFGWSAQERDAWIVPTVFFAIISFGCCMGSTTAITFAVDSYRQYAGEALVTLNWSKNIFHGLVFSLFFNSWLESDGSRSVFLAIGGIQLGVMVFTIPMYMYGKRARMWTVRKRMMERL